MINVGKSAMFAWAILMQAGAATASEPASTGVKPNSSSSAKLAGNSSRETLESKLRLVKLLLAQSPAVQRIPQSNNSHAKKKLADAHAHYLNAKADADAGRGEAAILLLDESLRQIVSASYLVPDAAQQATEVRSRNMELREATSTFKVLHKNLASRLATRNGTSAAGATDMGRIDAMMHEADALLASNKQHEANLLLNKAYKIVVFTLNQMLAAETIVYDLKFNSPAEEFRHELARNRSYEDLIPIALAQLNTARESATRADGYVQKSRSLRETAQKQASGGEHPAAVKNIQDATRHLQHALQIVGLVIPQSPEIQP